MSQTCGTTFFGRSRLGRGRFFRLATAGMAVLVADLAFFAPAAGAVDGDLDLTWDSDGIATTSFSTALPEAANAVAIHPAGGVVAAGDSDGDLAAVKYSSIGGSPTAWTDTPARTARGMAVQPDGKIVTVGGEGGVFRVARYNANGSLDDGGAADATPGDSFGVTGGRVITGVGQDGAGRAVAIQSDGKIVAAGYADVDPTSGSSRFEFVLARYLRNGDLDDSFGTGGLVTTSQAVPSLSTADSLVNQRPPNTPAHNYAHAVTIQPNGRIVVAGTTRRYFVSLPVTAVDNDFVLVGYLPTGELDPSFGTPTPDTKALMGKTVTDVVTGQDDIANSVALHADGRIVVGGRTSAGSGDFAVARYSRNGALVQKHNQDIGTATADRGNAVIVQRDDKVVMAGNSGTNCAVIRTSVTSLATLDSTFGASGKVTKTSCRYNAVAVQPDAKIVAAGSNGDGTDFRVDRYQAAATAPTGITIGDVTALEGSTGATPVVFTVTAPAAPAGAQVSYTTGAGTATAEADYVSTSGTMVFGASAVPQTMQVSVLVNADTVVESDETFFVNLYWPVNTTIGDPQAVGTIDDDDLFSSSLSIGPDPNALLEGDGVATVFPFTVTLSSASASTVTVDYTTVYGNAGDPGNPATSSDFLPVTSGTVVLQPGATTQTARITVNGDNFTELNENFHVFLSNATNASIGDGLAAGQITNDD